MDEYRKSRQSLKTWDSVALLIFLVIVIFAELALFVSMGASMMYSGFRNGPAILVWISSMVLVLIVAFVWYVAVIILCSVTKSKGAHAEGLRLAGLVASPIVLALIVIAMPDKSLNTGYSSSSAPTAVSSKDSATPADTQSPMAPIVTNIPMQ
ncbi:MAG TPA: hypothetical protein DEB24_00895 [Coriobacteriia bacterium]|nr:hypothetical protein [Coriobacteriia bacterium]